MNLYKTGYEFAKTKPTKGLGHFARVNGVNVLELGRKFFQPQGTPLPIKPRERVLVVGGGVAGFNLCEALFLRGHRPVTLISEKDLLGGKCVQFGCMLSEYLTASGGKKYQWAEAQSVVSTLSQSIEDKIKRWGFDLKTGHVSRVDKKKVWLEDGTSVSFDRLIISTGSRSDWAKIFDHFPTWTLHDFWRKTCDRLLIVTHGNPAALSLADLAVSMGRKVTLAVAGSHFSPKSLPSFRYFADEVRARGAEILFETPCIERDGALWLKDSQGLKAVSDYDAVLPFDFGSPALPQIDGFRSLALDYDFATGSLRCQPDVYLIGESAGMVSAAEAELHAQLLMDSWYDGAAISGLHFEGLPWRFHAEYGLGGVGKPWAFFSKDWQELDFNQLGWSFLHGERGKLWYIFNRDTRKFDAIHICHKESGRLIAMAALLIDYAVDDPRWRQFFVHPEASEVFKLLCYTVRAKYPHKAPVAYTSQFSIPDPSRARESQFFTQSFSQGEIQRGIMDRDPAGFFASALVLKRHEHVKGSEVHLARDEKGELINPEVKGFACTQTDEGYLVRLENQIYQVRLNLDQN